MPICGDGEMSDLAREVQKNYAKQLIEEAKKRANKTISDAYELLEKETKQQAETIERLRAAISNLDSMETPSDIKGRFQSELFWRGVYAARDALNKLEAGGV